ncbi:MAG TPA: hypothetical protein VK789_20290 [Bryobacteraceae bacterium]|nr:hypothetical protein [Bryobacteraceae bacterium]
MEVTLKLSFSADDLEGLFHALLATGLAGRDTPDSLFVDTSERKPGADWFDKWSGKYKHFLKADWEGGGWLSVNKGRIVKLSKPQYDLDPARFLSVVESLPFSVGCAAALYPQWTDGSMGEEYLAPSFGDMHWPLGWGCFFRGEGHKRLCSRRWLEFGPWRLIQGNNDTSLVVFHDLRAEAATALDQARAGHERMGISPAGGFIQTGYAYASDLKGKYYPEQRKLHIVVHGRDVPQREMLDACAARLYQALGPENPLDNIMYVFVEEDKANAHLHELWLRDLECHVFREGVEIDLIRGYNPSPQKPDWVRSLD